ncbi:hypothetical protein MN116_007494 [Schistosoma mekongi]|uniref:Uncharacterized protein n=1 Tax=Schistosoma mekongi TaxID=38744 RepID=A0AAE2D2H5_SCHME|nr:hypothetical protein MN116_007494 [Schistosoma mekongi]
MIKSIFISHLTVMSINLHNQKESYICQCLCFRLIDTTKNNVDEEKVTPEEEIMLMLKAKALSNFLFLKDDIFTIETLKLYKKKAITIQPLNTEDDFKKQQYNAFQSISSTTKVYLQNKAKQMNRYALLTVLNKVTELIV